MSIFGCFGLSRVRSAAATVMGARTTSSASRGTVFNHPVALKDRIERIGTTLGVKRLEDWYAVPATQLILQDRYLHNHFGNSINMLRSMYPDHPWEPWKFRFCPRRWWRTKANRVEFMKWLERQLNISTLKRPQDWLRIDFIGACTTVGAKQLARLYPTEPAFRELLHEAWPEVEWPEVERDQPAEISHKWQSPDQQRAFLSDLIRSLGLTGGLEAYYNLSYTSILKHGGGGMLLPYQGSVSRALTALYPEHEWLPWKFKPTPRNFWASLENRRIWFDWCAKQLCISSLDGWYSVSTLDITRHGGRSLLVGYYNGSLHEALTSVYPAHSFDAWKMTAKPLQKKQRAPS